MTSGEIDKYLLVEDRIFRGGYGKTYAQTMEGLETMADIHTSVEHVGAMKLKPEVAEGLRMRVVMSVSDDVQAVSNQMEAHLTRTNLLAVFVPGWSRKASAREAIVTIMLSTLEHSAFHDETRERDRWEGTGYDPGEIVKTGEEVE